MKKLFAIIISALLFIMAFYLSIAIPNAIGGNMPRGTGECRQKVLGLLDKIGDSKGLVIGIYVINAPGTPAHGEPHAQIYDKNKFLWVDEDENGNIVRKIRPQYDHSKLYLFSPKVYRGLGD